MLNEKLYVTLLFHVGIFFPLSLGSQKALTSCTDKNEIWTPIKSILPDTTKLHQLKANAPSR